MRPTKLTEKVLHTFSEVLAEDHVLTVCTDEEICILVNQYLEPEERISYRTFQRYKAMAMRGVHPEQVGELMSEMYQELYRLWRLAVIHQKKQLAQCIQDAKQGWQRFKWLLEKKCREWEEVPHMDFRTDPKFQEDLKEPMKFYRPLNWHYAITTEQDDYLIDGEWPEDYVPNSIDRLFMEQCVPYRRVG